MLKWDKQKLKHIIEFFRKDKVEEADVAIPLEVAGVSVSTELRLEQLEKKFGAFVALVKEEEWALFKFLAMHIPEDLITKIEVPFTDIYSTVNLKRALEKYFEERKRRLEL